MVLKSVHMKLRTAEVPVGFFKDSEESPRSRPGARTPKTSRTGIISRFGCPSLGFYLRPRGHLYSAKPAAPAARRPRTDRGRGPDVLIIWLDRNAALIDKRSMKVHHAGAPMTPPGVENPRACQRTIHASREIGAWRPWRSWLRWRRWQANRRVVDHIAPFPFGSMQ